MRIVGDRSKALCEKCGNFDQFGYYHHKKYRFEILNNPDNIEYLCTVCHYRTRSNGERFSKYSSLIPEIKNRLDNKERIGDICTTLNIPRGSWIIIQNLIYKSGGTK